MMSRHQAAHALTGAPSQYALIDDARRARLGQTREEYAAAMGALFAPFTRGGGGQPARLRSGRADAAELVTPTEANRPIADPYTRYIVAREKVNQGAAVLLMSVAAARRLGVRRPVGVLLGHADLRERDLMTGPTCPRARLRRWPSGTRSTWPVSAPATCPRSTCTCFPAPVSASATASAWPPATRAG